MFLTPTAVLGVWFRGILSIAIVAGGIWLIYEWYEELPRTASIGIDSAPMDFGTPIGSERESNSDTSQRTDSQPMIRADGLEEGLATLHDLTPIQRLAAWRPGFDRRTTMLVLGIACLLFCVAGRWLRPSFFQDVKTETWPKLPNGLSHEIKRPDGSQLHVEVYGRRDAPSIILTHGWGMNRLEWVYLVNALSERFQVILWDLPGLGKSTPPYNRDYRLEKLAEDLRAVIEFSGSGPVTLIGHSIGGMITLTLCRLFPELLEIRVVKLVLVHTTYTNPLRTTFLSGLYTAIQKPVIVPLLYLQIALAPLVWFMTWMSYWNGSLHRSTMRNGFTGKVSRTKLNFTASFSPKASPAVLARGALGMLGYDATGALPKIGVPVLVISAAEDPLTMAQASEYMNANLPNAELLTLQPAKHFGLLEYDVQVAHAVTEFCARGATRASVGSPTIAKLNV